MTILVTIIVVEGRTMVVEVGVEIEDHVVHSLVIKVEIEVEETAWIKIKPSASHAISRQTNSTRIFSTQETYVI